MSLPTPSSRIGQRRFAIRPFALDVSASTRIAAFTGIAIVLHIYSYFDYLLLLYGPHLSRAYVYYAIFALAIAYLVADRRALPVLSQYRAIVILELIYFLYISLQYAFSNFPDYADVRDAYVVKGQFVMVSIATLIIFGVARNFRTLQLSFTAVALFSSAMNVVEFFAPSMLPWQLTVVPGRSAGFYGDPNISALAIAIVLPLLSIDRSLVTRLFLYAATGVGVFLTFSRGGWALWAVAAAMSEIFRINWRTFRVTSGTLISAGFLIIALVIVLVVSPTATSAFLNLISPNLDANTSDRLSYFMNDSTISRLELARDGWNAFLAAPLFGNGVGFTAQWQYGPSVHNMFILTLAEQGVLGFAWLMLFYWAVIQQGRYGPWIVALACVASFTTHNLFDGPGFGIALSGYLAAGEFRQRKKLPALNALVGSKAPVAYRPRQT